MGSEVLVQGFPTVGGDAARRRWRRHGLLLALACVSLVVAFSVASLRQPEFTRRAELSPAVGRTEQSGAAAITRLRSLGLQAQSVISGALASGRAVFAATAYADGYRFEGDGLDANLSHGAVSVRSAGGSFSLALAGVGRGGHFSVTGPMSSSAHANRVTYAAGGGLREWFAAGPLGIEQGFALSRRPAGASGPVTAVLRLGGSLRPELVGSEVRFLSASGRVSARYGGLVATDAAGRRLPAMLVLHGRSLLLRVDDRGATYPLRIDPFIQQGEKLVGNCTSSCEHEGTGETGNDELGWSVALSGDGNTALVGDHLQNGNAFPGSVWVFTRSEGVWVQQAALVGDCTSSCSNEGTGEIGNGGFGESVALSSDGNTALIGAPSDNGSAGAAWVFTRSNGVWTQQGPKLSGEGVFGRNVALSSDGNTALIGAPAEEEFAGAGWVFVRSDGVWSTQGTKLVGDCEGVCPHEGTGETEGGALGNGVALSADGDTALVGGSGDNDNEGAVWVFVRSGGAWSQQGSKLVGDCTSDCPHEGTGEANGLFGGASFGGNVALSADGDTALIGAYEDNHIEGAAWVFTRSAEGVWTQQGAKLVADCASDCAHEGAGEIGEGAFSSSVALSADGNVALIGAYEDNHSAGAAWLFTRSAEGTWSQRGPKLVGDCTGSCVGEGTGEIGEGTFGSYVALSATATTALIGGFHDNGSAGAAWIFGAPGISGPPSLSFGSQTTGLPGPVSWLQLQSSGQDPLTFTGEAQVTGADAADFTIPAGDEQCDGRTLDAGEACWIGVQFTAGADGSQTATLRFGANNAVGTESISLTGTGVPANSGPAGVTGTNGTNGTNGAQGSAGTQGPVGAQGSTGAKGPAGPVGKVELVTCKKVKGKQRCTAKLVAGTVKFTTIGLAARARLSRHGVVYAAGTARTARTRMSLRLTPLRPLRPGKYTLTLISGTGRHVRISTRSFTLG